MPYRKRGAALLIAASVGLCACQGLFSKSGQDPSATPSSSAVSNNTAPSQASAPPGTTPPGVPQGTTSGGIPQGTTTGGMPQGMNAVYPQGQGTNPGVNQGPNAGSMQGAGSMAQAGQGNFPNQPMGMGQGPGQGMGQGPGQGMGQGPGQPMMPAFPPKADVPSTAPDFSLTTLEGQPAVLHDMVKKGPVLLCFGKTECGTCNRVMNAYDLFATHYAAKNPKLQFLAIFTNSTEEIARFKQGHNLHLTFAPDDASYSVNKAYKIEHTPTLVLVGSKLKTEQVLQGWNRNEVNSFAKTLSTRLGIAYQDISTANDGLSAMEIG